MAHQMACVQSPRSRQGFSLLDGQTGHDGGRRILRSPRSSVFRKKSFPRKVKPSRTDKGKKRVQVGKGGDRSAYQTGLVRGMAYFVPSRSGCRTGKRADDMQCQHPQSFEQGSSHQFLYVVVRGKRRGWRAKYEVHQRHLTNPCRGRPGKWQTATPCPVLIGYPPSYL